MAGETEMTGTATTTTAGGGTQPKTELKDIEAQMLPTGEDEEELKKRKAEQTLWTRIWQGLAGATIVFEILAVIFFYRGVVLFAMIVGIGVSAAVVKFQMDIEDTDSLRIVQNQIRHQVNDFAKENTKLTESNIRLEGQLAPLKEIEQKLQKIAEANGTQVKKLQSMVRENQSTISEMKSLVEADVVYEMIETILESDRSEDGEFSDKEIRMLAIRLEGLPAIKLNRELFIEAVKKDRNIHCVVELVKTIHDKDIPEEEKVVVLSDDFDINDIDPK